MHTPSWKLLTVLSGPVASRGFVYALLCAGWWVGLMFPIHAPMAQETGFGAVVEPDQYLIQPGDKFRIDFWDGVTPTINVEVTPEGAVLIAAMGRLEIADLTLTRAKAALHELVRGYYPDADFSISLDGIRSTQILVIGAVRNPGLYDGYVSQQVSEFIRKAGGLVAGASQRNISLCCNGNTSIHVDLLQFERLGSRDANPLCYAGSVIKVPLLKDSSAFIQIAGAVTVPGGYEYREDDDLGTLIDLALGLNGLEGDSVLVYRTTPGGSTPMAVALDHREFAIRAGDKIIVQQRTQGFIPDYIAVTGQVAMPGRYPFHARNDLVSALAMAGGITGTADMYALTIYRRPGYEDPAAMQNLVDPASRNHITLAGERIPLSLNPEVVASGRLESVTLVAGDSIVVPQTTGSVSIFGQVRRPGAVPFDRPISAGTLARMAGGYAPKADQNSIQIIRKAGGQTITSDCRALVYDGDVVIIPEKRNAGSFWEKIRDISLVLGGLSLVYLAVDNATD
ncbi:MAG: SLBB domain-containing protein [candidate division Zixibacteria bacterium]|nr:SLBB domain-containing protein [candidate division Zixibacteria bacterium]